MHRQDIKNRSSSTGADSGVTPAIVLNTRFHDTNTFTSSIDWDLDFRQLGAGPLAIDLLGIAGRDFMLLGVDFNRLIHQLGAPPAGMFTFAVPFLNTPEFKWCSGSARGGSLISFNLEHNYDAVVPPYSALTISIKKERLRVLAEEVGLHWSLERVFRSCIHWRNEHSIRLARQLEHLTRMARAGTAHMAAYSEFLNESLPRAILAVLFEGLPDSASTLRDRKHPVLRKALEIINDHESTSMKVIDLCALVECSPATLRRVFVSEIGVSPKIYLKNRCLSAVRDILADPLQDRSVAEIANEWGFWHMGQFARDYRAMFGELPSVTLKRH